jgi:hypothetical protein
MVAGLAGNSYAQQVKSPAATRARFRISGTVVNAIGNQPLAQVTVLISRADNLDQTADQVASDEDGHFSFENVTPGKYAMTAQRRGFAQQSYQQHDQYSTAVAVGPGQVSENLIFQISPDASISGTVTDEQNENVRNGRAMLFKSGLQDGTQSVKPWGQATLDDGGRYRFDHLEPGKYYVAVLARPWFAQYLQSSSQRDFNEQPPAPQSPTNPDLDVAYPLTYYPSATDSSGAALITVGPGDRAVADIALSAVAAAHVHIINLEDAGNVVLFQPTFEGGKVPLFAETSEVSAGTVEVSGIAPGRFILNLESADGENSTRQDREINLAGGEQIDARQRLASTASVVGTVHLENSKTIPAQLFLRFRQTESGEAFGVAISEKGQFEVRHDLVKPGNYEVGLVNADGTVAVKSLSATGAKVMGHTISLTGGSSVKLDVQITKALGKIDGVVLREGKPQSQCMVLLLPQDTENNRILIRRDQSDSDGTFTLFNVVPGKYTLVAIEKGWDLEWGNPAVLKPYLQNGQAMEVDAPGTYQVKLKAQ